MRQKKIHHLVVTDGAQLQGIVSVSDLLELFARKPEHKSNCRERRAGADRTSGTAPQSKMAQ